MTLISRMDYLGGIAHASCTLSILGGQSTTSHMDEQTAPRSIYNGRSNRVPNT